MDANIYINGLIGKIGEEQGVTLLDVITQFQSQKGATRYIINIDSPGGNVHEAKQIRRFLEGVQETFELIAIGNEVASAATLPYLAILKRSAGDNFKFMAHNPAMIDISGDAEMLEEYAKHVKGLEKEFEQFYATTLGLHAETVSDIMDAETDIDSAKARTLGIINYDYKEIAVEMNIHAISTKSKKIKKMDKETKNWFEEKFNAIASVFEKKTVALNLMTKEGVELVFPGEAPEEGVKVDAPDGTYTVTYNERDWTVVVNGGIVESITEIVDNEVDDLRAENEKLKTQLAEMQAAHESEIEAYEKVKETVGEMQAKITAMQEVTGKEPEVKPGENTPPAAEPVDSFTEAIMKRKEAAKERVAAARNFKLKK